jgi:exopolysaccharide/PEP-CTERM locus tyrosine autokinase
MTTQDKSSHLSDRGKHVSSVEKAVELLAGNAVIGGGEQTIPGATDPLRAAFEVNENTRQTIRIDHQKLARDGMIGISSERSLIAEEFRFVKRPLLLRAFEQSSGRNQYNNLIMVTSARPGEGKTFSAINLAMSIALERDLTVMLIDADIANPSIPERMGFKAETGLIDLITDDKLKMSDVLLRTDIENLTILPAGRSHHLATELFASEKMERLVNDIARRYPDRIIIIDTPPVLLSSIPSVIALYVGQMVFVVQAEASTETAIDSALGSVSSCENIYLLLNKARTMAGEKLDGYYGYYS